MSLVLKSIDKIIASLTQNRDWTENDFYNVNRDLDLLVVLVSIFSCIVKRTKIQFGPVPINLENRCNTRKTKNHSHHVLQWSIWNWKKEITWKKIFGNSIDGFISLTQIFYILRKKFLIVNTTDRCLW